MTFTAPATAGQKEATMTIAIIGTGNMASGLARRLARAGQDVVLGSRDPAKAAALAATLGDHVQSGGIAAVMHMADVAVMAVPFDAVPEVLASAGDFAGKILVDITNPITPDYMALTIGHTTSAAEEIQKLAVGAVVVKAFNTVFADILSTEEVGGPTTQVFIAADDREAASQVALLVRAIGFEPVQAGPLANARYLEPVGELNIQMGYALGHGTLTAPSWIRLASQPDGS